MPVAGRTSLMAGVLLDTIIISSSRQCLVSLCEVSPSRCKVDKGSGDTYTCEVCTHNTCICCGAGCASGGTQFTGCCMVLCAACLFRAQHDARPADEPGAVTSAALAVVCQAAQPAVGDAPAN